MQPLRLHTHRDRDQILGGRASLWAGDRKIASAEAHALTSHVLAGVSLDADESAIIVKAAAGPWLSVAIPIPHQLRDMLADLLLSGLPHRPYDDVDVFEVSIHHGAFWWSILHTTDAWSSTTPRWRHGSWHAVDRFLGKEESERLVLSVHEVDVPMPERTYRWRIELTQHTVKRKRWPWPRVWLGYEATALEGEQIPHPGKGENSYDCDDDATFACSGQARGLDEAVANVVRAVLRQRVRYGGKITFGTLSRFELARETMARELEKEGTRIAYESNVAMVLHDRHGLTTEGAAQAAAVDVLGVIFRDGKMPGIVRKTAKEARRRLRTLLGVPQGVPTLDHALLVGAVFEAVLQHAGLGAVDRRRFAELAATEPAPSVARDLIVALAGGTVADTSAVARALASDNPADDVGF